MCLELNVYVNEKENEYSGFVRSILVTRFGGGAN